MSKIPPIEELREKYKDVMENKAVTNMTIWHLSGGEYPANFPLLHAEEIGKGMAELLDEHVDAIDYLFKKGKTTMPRFESRFNIGELVRLNFYIAGKLVKGTITAVTFTNSKVLYDIAVPINEDQDSTILSRVDSVCVEEYREGD